MEIIKKEHFMDIKIDDYLYINNILITILPEFKKIIQKCIGNIENLGLKNINFKNCSEYLYKLQKLNVYEKYKSYSVINYYDSINNNRCTLDRPIKQVINIKINFNQHEEDIGLNFNIFSSINAHLFRISHKLPVQNNIETNSSVFLSLETCKELLLLLNNND